MSYIPTRTFVAFSENVISGLNLAIYDNYKDCNCHKPNSTTIQLNQSWVLHENDFAHHHHHPTPSPLTTSPPARPGNYSWLSVPRFDSKIFCESAVITTLKTASNIRKYAKSIRRSDRKLLSS